MANTPHLGLPLLSAAQAQKHVTVNESLEILDDIVHISVINRTRTSPPGSPSEGDHYIVASGATGDWSGQDNNLAVYHDSTWTFYTPDSGWTAWDEQVSARATFDGTSWNVGATLVGFQWVNVTISGGEASLDGSALILSPETGSTDDLDTIEAAGVDGTLVILRAASGKTITVTETDNIALGATTRVLDDPTDILVLVKAGSTYCEMSYSDNG